MRIVSLRLLREHWQKLGREDSEQPLKTWYTVVRNAQWASHNDIKATYGARVDLAHGKYAFDVAGNKYRVICSIDFARHGVLVLWIGTYAEYDKLLRNDGRGLKTL